jgi:probable HAF family extracellular repeat protein
MEEQFMKSLLIWALACSLLTALATAQPKPRYTVIDLGTLGGAYSFPYGINNAGMVAGGSATSSQTDFLSQTAFLWFHDQMISLGTLPGSACPTCSSEGAGISASGDVAIESETSMPDPNNEDFCYFRTHRQCLGAIWRNNVMRPLQTLPGGNNTSIFWMNNRGQVSGTAENDVPDANCATPFQVRQFQPVIWGPDGKIQRVLSPLVSEGDTVAFAFTINDRGEVAGSSGPCSGVMLPPGQFGPDGVHAVLWEKDGTPKDLGNLGSGSNIATSVNNRGDVVGTARSAKDGKIHTFRWTRKTGMKDIGGFPGADATVAGCCHTINDRGDVVGFAALQDGSQVALLWQGDMPTDLNQYVRPGSPFAHLDGAFSINDAGEIAGIGTTKSGDAHAFLAIPSIGAAEDDGDSTASQGVARSAPPAIGRNSGWRGLR